MSRIYLENINIYIDDDGAMYDSHSGTLVTQSEYEQRISNIIKDEDNEASQSRESIQKQS